jgi:hypothetical protein
MIEDVVDMLSRGTIARNGVLLTIKAEWELNRTLLGQRKPACLCDSLLSSSPPTQLSQVRQDDAGALGVRRGSGEGLDVFDEVDRRALVDSAFAADDAVREDAEVLIVFVEEDDDSLFGLDVGGDEDWEVGLGFFGVEGQTNLVETERGEAIGDDGADCFCLEVSYWK